MLALIFNPILFIYTDASRTEIRSHDEDLTTKEVLISNNDITTTGATTGNEASFNDKTPTTNGGTISNEASTSEKASTTNEGASSNKASTTDRDVNSNEVFASSKAPTATKDATSSLELIFVSSSITPPQGSISISKMHK